MRFRKLNELYANMFGYFWKPCPICEKYFGGHEISKSPASLEQNEKQFTIPNIAPISSIICPDCEKVAKYLKTIVHSLNIWKKVTF